MATNNPPIVFIYIEPYFFIPVKRDYAEKCKSILIKNISGIDSRIEIKELSDVKDDLPVLCFMEKIDNLSIYIRVEVPQHYLVENPGLFKESMLVDIGYTHKQ